MNGLKQFRAVGYYLVGFCMGMHSCNAFHSQSEEQPELVKHKYEICIVEDTDLYRYTFLRDGEKVMMYHRHGITKVDPGILYVNPRLEVMLGGKITLAEENR